MIKKDKQMIKKGKKSRKIAIFHFFCRIFAPLEANMMKK
jgi:hypothetical protein